MEREKAIEELKEICCDIGCSGLEPDMCQNNPHHCKIIQKLLKAKPSPPEYSRVIDKHFWDLI